MTTIAKKKFLSDLRREIKKLSSGEEAYLASMYTVCTQYLAEGKDVKAKQVISTYPMPTPTLEAARALMVAL